MSVIIGVVLSATITVRVLVGAIFALESITSYEIVYVRLRDVSTPLAVTSMMAPVESVVVIVLTILAVISPSSRSAAVAPESEYGSQSS